MPEVIPIWISVAELAERQTVPADKRLLRGAASQLQNWFEGLQEMRAEAEHIDEHRGELRRAVDRLFSIIDEAKRQAMAAMPVTSTVAAPIPANSGVAPKPRSRKGGRNA